MVVLSHILGFPRIGLHRELKKAQENYWSGKINRSILLDIGKKIRILNWKQQKSAGLDLLTVGDFAWYDHVLNTSLMVNNVPFRHRDGNNDNDIDTLFRIGRGQAPTGKPAFASEMTKWFNTNYHYIVPEFTYGQTFQLGWTQLLDEVDEAIDLGYTVKPVLLGPISYLWLGKIKDENKFDRLSLLPNLILVYKKVLNELSIRNIEWVQIDEPILVLELSTIWKNSYLDTYKKLQGTIKLLLTTYFDSIGHHLDIITKLPVQGLHVDLVSGSDNINILHNCLPKHWILSAGIVNGRNIWRTDLYNWFKKLYPLINQRKFWVGSSCSLLHVPIDLNSEIYLNKEVKDWFSFALQKCMELNKLCIALNQPNNNKQENLNKYNIPINNRFNSNKVNNQDVQIRLKK